MRAIRTGGVPRQRLGIAAPELGAVVMGTGIVSVALSLDGAEAVSRIMLARSRSGSCFGINNVESLAGREIASYFANLNAGVEEFSPTVRFFIDQDALEPILRARRPARRRTALSGRVHVGRAPRLGRMILAAR